MCGSDVLPGPAIAFALGLYVVTVWGRSSFQGCTHSLLGTGKIPLGLGPVAVAPWHCVYGQSIAFDSVSSPAGSSGHAPYQQGLKACWGAVRSVI